MTRERWDARRWPRPSSWSPSSPWRGPAVGRRARDRGRAGGAGEHRRRWNAGHLSDAVSQYGILTYRARPDGSPYAVINRARGTYTELPARGDKVGCGDVLYRVDDEPVLLLCGSTPGVPVAVAWATAGRDVAELNANLVHLGYAMRAQLDPRPHLHRGDGGRAAEAAVAGGARIGPARSDSAGRSSCPSRCGSPR